MPKTEAGINSSYTYYTPHTLVPDNRMGCRGPESKVCKTPLLILPYKDSIKEVPWWLCRVTAEAWVTAAGGGGEGGGASGRGRRGGRGGGGEGKKKKKRWKEKGLKTRAE